MFGDREIAQGLGLLPGGGDPGVIRGIIWSSENHCSALKDFALLSMASLYPQVLIVTHKACWRLGTPETEFLPPNNNRCWSTHSNAPITNDKSKKIKSLGLEQ